MPKFHLLRVNDIRRETADCVSVNFEVPEELKEAYAFTQGQYLTLRTDINGEDTRRSYSICSGVDDGELRVAIKQVEGGLFSTYANKELKVGDELKVMTPMGNFFVPLDPKNNKHYVAFTAGSGITPVLSLIKTTLKREPHSTFTLFYTNSRVRSIIFREELEDLKDTHMGRLRLFHLLTREPSETPIMAGRMTKEKCLQLTESILDVDTADAFFLCGPAEMIMDVRQALEEKGVPNDKVHFELFTAPGLKKESAAPEIVTARQEHKGKMSKVEVILDGSRILFDLPYDGSPVLDAALERGADLPFSCKGGVCCTCRAKLVEGEVDMDLNYSLEPDEIERGFILTCQSHPRTERIVVDFDHQ